MAIYKSNKSARFEKWIQAETGIDPTVPAMRLIVELEKSARLLVHDFDQTGDVDPRDLRALARSVKELEEKYSDQP
jgi:hypothetical protein